jgi:hypothetical protein
MIFPALAEIIAVLPRGPNEIADLGIFPRSIKIVPIDFRRHPDVS